eukprot:6181738-Pyramimonas_sp.AAC.1
MSVSQRAPVISGPPSWRGRVHIDAQMLATRNRRKPPGVCNCCVNRVARSYPTTPPVRSST